MDKQHGGGFTVNGYIALALLALAAAEAVEIRHLFAHRSIEIHMGVTPVQQGIELTPYVSPDKDLYNTHTFPSNRTVCTALDTICWIRI